MVPLDITRSAIPASIHIPPSQLNMGEQSPSVVAEVMAVTVSMDVEVSLLVVHPYSIPKVRIPVKYFSIDNIILFSSYPDSFQTY